MQVKVVWLAFAILNCFNLFAQFRGASSTLKQDGTCTLPVFKSYDKNDQINPFVSSSPVKGLFISADVRLNSDSALVRIILVDKSNTEYLIYETYPLVSGLTEFSADSVGEETLTLNNVIPAAVRFELIDASVFLKEINTVSGTLPIETRMRLYVQNEDKIKKINRHIIEKGGKWVAGETPVSKLTFEEKKQLFGGKVPNLQGFEYYKGGIFVIPGTHDDPYSGIRNDTLYAKEFSWRNRHGQDWVTSVKNQGGCNSCWAFAAAGATELLINLYYNQHIDYDLSEQQLVSCITGNCYGGSTGEGLGYIQRKGIVNESCFPYQAADLNCDDICPVPSDSVKISEYNWYNPYADDLKKLLIRGPVSLAIASWNHAVTLVGYKTIQEGDPVYQKTDSKDEWITIPPGDPLIGQTSWLIKNSWGPFFGDHGYANVVLDMNNIINTYGVNGSIASLVYGDSDIACVDHDGDGYFSWGIGPKPPQCPPCPDQPDGDDSNPCLGSMDEFGHTLPSIPLPPGSEDLIVDISESVPDLHAEGSNIKWFSDSALTNLVCTGNDFKTGQTAGLFIYYVTQTFGSCESKARATTLKILVPPPLTEDVQFCEGIEPGLTATGENIKWYRDTLNWIKDTRDGQMYKTAIIGNQKWMAGNLNYRLGGSVYYMNDSTIYHQYGRLYNLVTAQAACPQGWSLPTDSQWKELEQALGMSGSEADKSGRNRGTNEGNKLKEAGTSHWFTDSGATDEVGFTLLPAGEAYNGLRDFRDLGTRANLWTYADFGRIPYSYARILSGDDSSISRAAYHINRGMSVRCIRTQADLEQIGTGNRLITEDTIPGIYNYFVSQEISGLESERKKVKLLIQRRSSLPSSEHIRICEGMQVPDLIATGENIRWYDDAGLTHLVHTGSNFASGDSLPGTHIYYVTQETVCGESKAEEVDLIINPLPEFTLGRDTTLDLQEKLVFDMDSRYTGFEWYNGVTSRYLEVQGKDLGFGNKKVWLTVTDTNHCSSTDTLGVTVLKPTGIQLLYDDKNIVIYPNPGSGIFTIRITNHEGEIITVSVLDQNGSKLIIKEFHLSHHKELIPVDMSLLTNGIYFFRIAGDHVLYFEKVIKGN